MNRKLVQKDKIIDIISKDANFRGHYFGPEEGQCCVIGGLISQLSEPEQHKIAAKKLDEGVFGNQFSRFSFDVKAAIFETYGLNNDACSDLQWTNDKNIHTETRRKALIKIVTELPEYLEQDFEKRPSE